MTWTNASKWIWINSEPQEDTYGEFVSSFEYTGGNASVKLSVDSNYVLYVNGSFVASEQYPDYPHYKVYDDIDITKFCKAGTNRLAILAWYYGRVFMTHYPGKAALRFEVCCDGETVAFSDETTLSRLSTTYENGLCHTLTPQLGFGYHYDATKEDAWIYCDEPGFSKSFLVDQNLPLHKRAIKKTIIGKRTATKLIKHDKNYYLYDIGYEEVGYLTLKVASESKQKIKVCFGEHIEDGMVRSTLPWRDFFFEITVKEGTTEYTNYMRRLGCRYLELHAEEPLEIEFLSVLPCAYPLNKIPKTFKNPLHQKIYDVAVRTLELCLHDHYEDCPWREQGLYAMDSRNQIICGYYAFKEYAVPRDNLYLMSRSDRDDHLLSICIPTSFDYAIPSFSLHYITEIYEYTLHSGDLTLAKEVLPELRLLIKSFTDRIENGLIGNFISDKSPGYWNFYEWREGLNGYGEEDKKPGFSAALNCLLSLALQRLEKICELLGEETTYGSIAEILNSEIHKAFFDEKKGLYTNKADIGGYSELVNALAILCGAATGEIAENICQVLASDNDLTKVSLSMACFKYDALLQVNEAKYAPFVISNLETVYKKMLDAGATSFWEDEEGAEAFAKAGSLCHGWSAMPVYYFHRLEQYL